MQKTTTVSSKTCQNKNAFSPFFSGLLLILIACGGSSSDDTPPQMQPPPPPVQTENLTVHGVVVSSANDSLQIGTTSYEVGGATIVKDGVASQAADIKSGMLVTLAGTREVATPTNVNIAQVTFDDDLEGPISSINIAASSFTVLGQRVLVDNLTVFENTRFDLLQIDNLVEVSGIRDAAGNILATFVELKAAQYIDGTEIEVKGQISNLDESNQTFSLGSLVVDYSQALLEDIPNNTLQNGLLVEVKATSAPQNNLLAATKVEGKANALDPDDNDEVELEGLVTEFTSAQSFAVSGIPVTTDAQTQFENGSSTDIQLGVRVEVKGQLSAQGVINAREVSFKIENDIEIEAMVDAIDSNSQTLTLLGISVEVTSTTMFRDESDSEISPFAFSDIQLQDFLQIKAHLSQGRIVAARVEKIDPEQEVELSAPVDNVNDPNLTLLGVLVVTTVNTEFENALEQPLTAAEFFALVQTGTLIKAEGSFDGLQINATEVEIED